MLQPHVFSTGRVDDTHAVQRRKSSQPGELLVLFEGSTGH